MAMCTVCNQRDVQVRGLFCTDACYFMTEAGVEEVSARDALKSAQRLARVALLATSVASVGGVTPAAEVELDGYANNDDGVDR